MWRVAWIVVLLFWVPQGLAQPLLLIPDHPLRYGLVAWYPLLPQLAGGVTLWDVVGTSHGILSGISSPPRPVVASDPTGRFPSVMRFDGQDDMIFMPDAPRLNVGTGDFSVCLFYRMPTIPFGGVEYSLVYKTAMYQFAPGWALEMFAPDTESVLVFFRITTDADPSNALGSASALARGPTYHICGTRSGQTATLYVNGVQNATQTDAVFAENVDNAESLTLAGTVATWMVYFPGLLSDLRIYNRALTAPEVFRLSTCTAPDYCGMVLHEDVVAGAVASTRRRSISITNY